MNRSTLKSMARTVAAVGVLLLPAGMYAQDAQPVGPNDQQAAPRSSLSPQQLDNLVAPLALYPDPLLSQVLVAATYPLELVEANQWLQQNRNLTGTALTDAARQQNWDPSVQALVAFPDVLARLNQDVRWTTDLGNAFLGQQGDVMSAVQRLRARAQANGKLRTTPQETVTTQVQDGQTAISIQPADPQVIYVPTYDPMYVWGAPSWGYYPSLFYPSYGFGFGFGIPIGGFYGGWGGWGGWGWGPNWFGRSIYVNGGFFNHYGYRYGGGYGYGGGYRAGFSGNRAWSHDSAHSPRVGGPAGNSRSYASANSGYRGGGNAGQSYNRGAAGQSVNRGNSASASQRYSGNSAGASQRYSGNSGAAQRYSGNSSSSAQRYSGSNAQSYSQRSSGASAQHYSAPAQRYSGAGSSAQHYSAPAQHYSAPAQRSFSGGGGSAPRMSGGGGGGSRGGAGGGGSRGGGGRR